MFLCSVAFLAGFGFIQFYGKIDDLANTLFQPSDKRKNSNITWKNLDAIIYGTELSDTQLNAKASVAGKFVYNPAEKGLLSAGTKQPHVDFIPDEIANYKTASKSVTIDVLKATPEIIFGAPAPISSGTKFTKALLHVHAQNPITKEEIKEGNFAFTEMELL